MDKIHFLKPKKSSQKIAQLSTYDQRGKQNYCKVYKMKTEGHEISKTIPLSEKKQSKSRKDHSIQAKSPIKIPNRNQQVTFRRHYTSEFDEIKQTSKHQTKKLTIQEIAIINQMWKHSCTLKERKIYEHKVDKIQILMKEMIRQVGQQLFMRESSEDGKTISMKSSASKNSEKNKKNSNQFYSTGDIHEYEQIKKQKVSEGSVLQTTQELQFKKIMYMLDDQNKMSKNHKVFLQQSNKSNQSNKSLENFLQSLSSFNQYETYEESGFTIQEIDKQSGNQTIFEQLQSCRIGPTSEQKRRTDRKNHKRQVLKDIVSMLNKKYNKNIQLQ